MLTLKKSFRFRQSLRTFPVIVSNNDPKISGKISFAIEDKPLIINKLIIDFSRGRQPIKRLCIACIHMCTIS
jgi:hypothetical protein